MSDYLNKMNAQSREHDMYQRAEREGDLYGYEDYLKNYPNGMWVKEAQQSFNDLKAKRQREDEEMEAKRQAELDRKRREDEARIQRSQEAQRQAEERRKEELQRQRNQEAKRQAKLERERKEQKEEGKKITEEIGKNVDSIFWFKSVLLVFSTILLLEFLGITLNSITSYFLGAYMFASYITIVSVLAFKILFFRDYLTLGNDIQDVLEVFFKTTLPILISMYILSSIEQKFGIYFIILLMFLIFVIVSFKWLYDYFIKGY